MKKLKLSLIFLIALGSACYESTDEEENKKTPVRRTSTPTETSTANNSAVNNSNNSTVNNSETANNSTSQTTQPNNSGEIKSGGFMANLPAGFVQPTDDVGKKILREYGAVFVARGGVIPPKTVIFRDESEVSTFQSSLQKSSENIGGFTLELQSAAMTGLKNAISEAKQSNLTISPRGADSAKRTYAQTVDIWKKRVEPGLKHWVSKGKLSQTEATRIKSLPMYDQIAEILRLEEKGVYFAASLDKSIMYSGAPPGTSQHLAMLAFDCKEFGNARVREILAKHGWFQTVVSDEPHFTFLGVKESELQNLGLKKEMKGGKPFWIPDI
jgi:hypothetical protein